MIAVAPCGVAAAALLAVSSCTVGPDYKAPTREAPEGFVGAAPSPVPGPESVPTPAPADPRMLARWWQMFDDPVLSSLIERAIDQNLDIRLAEARLVQARAARGVVASAWYPTVDASASATRSRSPIIDAAGNHAGSTGNFFRAGFDAAWEIDVFGGTRRAVEAAEADIAAADEDRRDVLVSIVAEVASTYFDLISLQRRLDVAQRNLGAQEESAQITRQRYEGGFVSGLDAANAEAQVASTRAVIPSLDAAAQQNRFALATLLVLPPVEMVDRLAPAALPDFPGVPPEVPVGLPSDLLQRRPDIRRAEAQLHAATARIGVATADLYPKFSLTGSFGLEGGKISALSTIADRFWSIGPAVEWNLFSGGRVQANIQVQRSLAAQAFDGYRKTILSALQDVESSLVAYTREQDRRVALVDAVDASRRAVDIATLRYTEGQTGFLDVLAAQRTLFATEDALESSRAAVVTDLVALYKALGGGWEDEIAAESSP